VNFIFSARDTSSKKAFIKINRISCFLLKGIKFKSGGANSSMTREGSLESLGQRENFEISLL